MKKTKLIVFDTKQARSEYVYKECKRLPIAKGNIFYEVHDEDVTCVLVVIDRYEDCNHLRGLRFNSYETHGKFTEGVFTFIRSRLF
jgi:hypothetical protein|tara:strand:+ start:2037 stop:2294 length:258 start_codon:yes stop_codon:yes gene_type:complete